MAPVTRSSLHGRPISNEGSWQVLGGEDLAQGRDADKLEEASDAASVQDQVTEDDSSEPSLDESFGQERRERRFPVRYPSTNIRHILEPLQQTADRVGRQVEDFARQLDRFLSSRDANDPSLWKDALDLAEAYGGMAASRKSQASSALLQARHSSRSRQSLQTLTEESQVEIQRAQNEADLWQLFSTLTSFQQPEVQVEYTRAQKTCLRGLHRYSSDSEIWQAFLSADQAAEEYQEIIRWLHQRATASRPSIDDVTERLRAKAERGDGIWSAGWLFTKESIKTQKRNRSLQKPLDALTPGLKGSHVRKSDSQPLVAQVDPDAQVRERAALEEPDEFHEQAAWISCWEMLRRGVNAETMREWWLERKETWRALSTRGAMLATLKDQEREWARFTGLWKASDWAASCYRICRSDAVSTHHEAAVFGLLCGDLQIPLQVCENMDDYLFVHLNAFLIERYRDFGAALTQRDSRHTFQPGPTKYDEIRQLMKYCQHNEKTMQEVRSPFKIIQSIIVSKTFPSFLLRHGRALAQLAMGGEHASYLIVNDGVREANEPTRITASDPDIVRMVAHLQLILKSLGYLDDLYSKHEEVVENNLAAYIGWLQQEGKMALIPLYASTISRERGARVLGAVIMDITDVHERDMIVKLMQRYELDVSRVLLMQYQLNATTTALSSGGNPRNFERVHITEYIGSGKGRHIKIKAEFMGDEVDGPEELLIRSLEWYRYGDRHCWNEACQVASTLYKVFFSQGRLAAARALCERAHLSSISRAALKADLKHTALSENTSEAEDVEADGFVEEDDEQVPPISPSKRRTFLPPQSTFKDDGQQGPNLATLTEQSQTWRQLEELVEALEAFARFNEAEAEVESTKGDPSKMRTMKKMLQVALEEVRQAMYPLLDSEYLSRPSDEAEAIPLRNIRNHYLPECILAYNSVLYFAGHVISRHCLVECMSLAQLVATNATLTEAFVESTRMKELVTAFALSSEALLRANEHGAKKGKRDDPIEIWQVKPQDVGLSKE